MTDAPLVDFANGQHDWRVTTTLRMNDVTLRTTVRRDAYEFQSFAYVEAFSPMDLRWNHIHELHWSQWVNDVPSVAALRVGKITKDDLLDAVDRIHNRMIQHVQQWLLVSS